MKEEMNIHQRLIQVAKTVPYLKKDLFVSTGGHGGYPAVSHDSVSSTTRGAFYQNGILTTASVAEYKEEMVEVVTQKGGRVMTKVTVAVDVSFINADKPDEVVTVRMVSNGLDGGDKAYGKAISLAVKMAYLKVLMIETGENEESRAEIVEREHKKISADKASELRSRLKHIGKDEENFMKWFSSTKGIDVTYFNNLPHSYASAAESCVEKAEIIYRKKKDIAGKEISNALKQDSIGTDRGITGEYESKGGAGNTLTNQIKDKNLTDYGLRTK